MENQNSLVPFTKLSADIAIAVKPVLSMVVADEATLNEATLAGKNVKHFAKLVEEKRKELVKPLNDEVKRINDYAKKIAAPLEQAETHIKKELRSYEIEVMARKRAEEQARLEKERKEREEALETERKAREENLAFLKEFGADENDIVREEIIAEASTEREEAELKKDVRSMEKSIAATRVSNTRKVWKHEVTDASLVPREFLIVDESAIRKAVVAGAREIAGVRIYEDVVVALR